MRAFRAILKLLPSAEQELQAAVQWAIPKQWLSACKVRHLKSMFNEFTLVVDPEGQSTKEFNSHRLLQLPVL